MVTSGNTRPAGWHDVSHRGDSRTAFWRANLDREKPQISCKSTNLFFLAILFIHVDTFMIIKRNSC